MNEFCDDIGDIRYYEVKIFVISRIVRWFTIIIIKKMKFSQFFLVGRKSSQVDNHYSVKH